MAEKIDRRKVEHFNNLCGGLGEGKKDYLLGTDDLAGRDGMFARIVLEPKASIGFHEHNGESETYYITAGEGIYFDGAKKFIAKPGDAFHCADGCGHSIENTGNGKLEFIALILPM